MEKKRNQQEGVNAECKRPPFRANEMPAMSSVKIYE